jgi:hypothetical protein
VEEGRIIMLTDFDKTIIQYVSILGSVIFIILMILLIRNRKLKEEFSILWLLFGVVFFVLSIWRGSLEVIARMLGIVYAPSAIFLILIVAIICILIHLSVTISKITDQNRIMIQEIGLLKMEVDILKGGYDGGCPENTKKE